MSEVVPPLWSSYLKATCGIGQAPKTREQSFYNPYCLCASYFLYSFHGCSPLVLNVIKTCINYHLSWTLKSETKGREFVIYLGQRMSVQWQHQYSERDNPKREDEIHEEQSKEIFVLILLSPPPYPLPSSPAKKHKNKTPEYNLVKPRMLETWCF